MSFIGSLTAEQLAVVNLPVESRAVVYAPAGTGKTHVLAARLNRLVERDELSAGDELLVLSFSRAAVCELRSRIKLLEGRSAYVSSVTFDSFATSLLAHQAPEGSWTQKNFDERIREATELLKSSSVPDAIRLVRHVLVDETQDLVGNRAAFVLAILEAADVGFTLFGDPAQAIYGYQADSQTLSSTNAAFYESIESVYAKSLSQWTLTHDFRSTVREKAAIAQVGDLLRGRNPDQTVVASELWSILLRLDTVTIATARRMLLTNSTGVSAVLCRTNAQVLRISQTLFQQGVPHRCQRKSENRAVGDWLARTVLDITEPWVSRAALNARNAEQSTDSNAVCAQPADEQYLMLRRLDPRRGDEIDLRRVASAIREQRIQHDIDAVPESPLVASTIHRAKGLEFDRVLICDPRQYAGPDLGEENRLCYVALTRARRELFHLEAPDTRGLTIDKPTGRWVRRGYRKNWWQVFELEAIGTDTEASRPLLLPGQSKSPRQIQQYILQHVKPGDPVDLVLAARGSHEQGALRFLIIHRSNPIGETSEEFGGVVQRLVGPRSPSPRSIDGLRVEMVDTVAGDALTAKRSGLGAHGLWARARIFGLGTLKFEEGSDHV